MKEFLNRLRRKWHSRKQQPVLQYPHAPIRRGTLAVGEGCDIGHAKIDLTGDVEIGDHTIIAEGVRIVTHHHHCYDGYVPNVVEEHGITITGIRIGSNVIVAMDAMILDQVNEIGDNSIVGARSMLTKDVGPNEIWAGQPREAGGPPPGGTLTTPSGQDGDR